jgi:hypothetical protein
MVPQSKQYILIDAYRIDVPIIIKAAQSPEFITVLPGNASSFITRLQATDIPSRQLFSALRTFNAVFLSKMRFAKNIAVEELECANSFHTRSLFGSAQKALLGNVLVTGAGPVRFMAKGKGYASDGGASTLLNKNQQLIYELAFNDVKQNATSSPKASKPTPKATLIPKGVPPAQAKKNALSKAQKIAQAKAAAQKKKAAQAKVQQAAQAKKAAQAQQKKYKQCLLSAGKIQDKKKKDAQQAACKKKYAPAKKNK